MNRVEFLSLIGSRILGAARPLESNVTVGVPPTDHGLQPSKNSNRRILLKTFHICLQPPHLPPTDHICLQPTTFPPTVHISSKRPQTPTVSDSNRLRLQPSQTPSVQKLQPTKSSNRPHSLQPIIRSNRPHLPPTDHISSNRPHFLQPSSGSNRLTSPTVS